MASRPQTTLPLPESVGPGPTSLPSPRARRRALLVAAGVSALLLFLAYRNVVTEGQSLVSTANYHPFDHRAAGLRPGWVRPPAYLNWHDQGASWWQWEPAGQFFEKALRRGEFPWWDPSAATGVDAHVNVTQGQYFPPYLLLLLLGNTPALRDAYYLLLVLGSGLACVLLLWRRGFHPVSAATMAGAFMLGGTLTFNINSIVGQAAATIPLMVLATDWFLDRPTWRRAGLLGLVLAFSLLSSFLPVVLSGFVLLPFLVLSRTLVRDGGAAGSPAAAVLPAGGRFAAAVVLGIAATAFLLLPLVKASSHDPHFQAYYANIGLQHYPWVTLFQFLSPRWTYQVWQLGDPATALFPRAWFVGVFYVGLVPFLLSALALGAGPSADRRLRVFFGGSGLFLLLKLFGVPPVQWLGYAPVFNQIHFIPYFGAALNFATAGLAAVGVEALIRRRLSGAGVVLVAAAALGTFSLLFQFAGTHTMNPAGNWQMPLFEAARLAAIAAGMVALAWLRHRRTLSGPMAGGLALALLALELVPQAYRPRMLRADAWKALPYYVEVLRADPEIFRVHTVNDYALPANVPQAVRLQSLSSRNASNPPRYNSLARRYFEVNREFYPVILSHLPRARVVLDMLNVKYVVAFDPKPPLVAQLLGAGLKAGLRDGPYQTFENPTAWPRAYLARRLHIAPTPAAALEAVALLERPDEVVLESRPLRAVPAEDAGAGECRIRQYRSDAVKIETDSPRPAVLVLSDAFAEGWTAEVNGVPAPVVPANYAFRAVEVPAGQATVVFRYRPPGLTAGLLITLLALGTMAVLAWWGGRTS